MNSGTGGHQGQAERYVLQRKRNDGGFRLPRSQRLMQRVYFESAQQELEKTFGAQTIASGITLFTGGNVRGVDKSGGRGNYHAHVIEGERHYYALLEIRPRVQGVQIGGICSCPAGFACAHLAAAALVVLAPSSQQTTTNVDADDELRPDLRDWLQAIGPQPGGRRTAGNAFIAYVCRATRGDLPKLISVATVPLLEDGSFDTPQIYNAFHLSNNSANYASVLDQGIGFELSRLAATHDRRSEHTAAAYHDLMRRMIATGRAFLGSVQGPRLYLGPPRHGALAWQQHADDTQDLGIELHGASAALMMMLSPWYIEADGCCGPIELDCSLDDLGAAIALPRLLRNELPIAQEALIRHRPGTKLPKAPGVAIEHHAVRPIPQLALRRHMNIEKKTSLSAELSFAYGAHMLSSYAAPDDLRSIHNGTLHIVPRDRIAELAARERLNSLGFLRLEDDERGLALFAMPSLTLPAERMAAFIHSGLGALKDDGWNVTLEPGIDTRIIDGDVAWHAKTIECARHWYDFSLDLDVDGERIALLPLLQALLRRLPGQMDPDRALRALASGDTILSALDDGRVIALPFQRVQRLLQRLYELQQSSWSGDALRVSMPQVLDLTQDENNAICLTDDRLRAFINDAAAGSAACAARTPTDFQAELRPYQQDGVGWMQRIREYELGGLLADEMGLGKTVQTLGHLAIEKEAGRLTHPTLIIVPTSLLANWEAEAARYAPSLRLLRLHGSARADQYRALSDSDVVLTTYALLGRDTQLQEIDWSGIILDEAQYIKNSRSKTARAARSLRSAYRICLSGTPIQNSLADLWSLFSFLLPGLLGDEKAFLRRSEENCRRNVAPFLLRRRKELVAADLPAKTEIVQRIELGGDQRDLYETVRIMMQNRVSDHIARLGIGESRMVVLDAILKLRQVCCDPRLLKTRDVRAGQSSAKLEALLELLAPLVAEGRQVIVFSSFTSMLKIIADRLQKEAIAYVTLTGETTDRATPVREFQAGMVPIFLISLRAGGTGLNLTAADTVIHYDQWWNPAVEAQATDRAHRIGQHKPVFVYKLIVAGSIEERILQIQENKRNIFANVLDLAALLEPAGNDKLRGSALGI